MNLRINWLHFQYFLLHVALYSLHFTFFLKKKSIKQLEKANQKVPVNSTSSPYNSISHRDLPTADADDKSGVKRILQ